MQSDSKHLLLRASYSIPLFSDVLFDTTQTGFNIFAAFCLKADYDIVFLILFHGHSLGVPPLGRKSFITNLICVWGLISDILWSDQDFGTCLAGGITVPKPADT